MRNRLTPDQVCEIPLMLDEGYHIYEIAEELGVTGDAIRKIIKAERWKRFEDTGEPPGKPDRCPDCGTMVLDDTKPCLECDLALKRRRRNEFAKLANSP